MGNKQSQSPQPMLLPIDCNCERVMPQVIKACCESVSSGVENTFISAVGGILGPNADLVSGVINKNDWQTTYNDYIENVVTSNANNIEPFALSRNPRATDQDLKNSNYCNCDNAAQKAIAKCNEGADRATNTIADIIDENADIFDGIASAGTIIGGEWPRDPSEVLTSSETSSDTNNWITKYFGSTRGTTIEPYEDYGLYKFVRQSLESRHRAFKDSPQFAQDCKSNATNSIKTFLTAELNDLNSLYKYYTTFVADHKTLLLDRGSMTDIISNKVAMLQEIQKKIDKYKTSLHMDDRNNNYLVSNYDIYKTVYFYYIIVYYSLFVLYLIFSKFIPEKQYTNKVMLLILFIYLIIPIILSYLINLTYDGYVYFLEFYNIKDDTQTYSSIIEKM